MESNLQQINDNKKVSELITEIAADMNKNIDVFKKFIILFEANSIKTVGDLKMLSD